MIPDTLNPEIHITTIELQNEINTEIKKPVNKSLTSVKIREILKQENAVHHESNTEVINVKNVDTAVSNVQGHGLNAAVTNIYRMENGDTNFRKMFHRYPKRDIRGIYPNHYWVQFNSQIPEDSSPMSYEPNRNSFLAIVFTITLVMLLITAWIVGYVYFSDGMRQYLIHDGMIFFIVGVIGLVMLQYTILLSPCARILPCNVIVLVLAVFFMSLVAASITAKYSTDIIFYALIATSITVLVCLLLALTSFDFTKFMLYIVAISVAFSTLVLIVLVVYVTTDIRYTPLTLGILFIGTILSVIILILELQMILGGKTVEISEDDWALAAFMLYNSIMDIFLHFVQLLGILEEVL